MFLAQAFAGRIQSSYSYLSRRITLDTGEIAVTVPTQAVDGKHISGEESRNRYMQKMLHPFNRVSRNNNVLFMFSVTLESQAGQRICSSNHIVTYILKCCLSAILGDFHIMLSLVSCILRALIQGYVERSSRPCSHEVNKALTNDTPKLEHIHIRHRVAPHRSRRRR